MSFLLRLLGLSTSGIASLFSMASGGVLMGIGRLPSWVAGAIAVILLTAGIGLLGWLHVTPNYRLGFIREITQINPDYAFLRLKSPFDPAPVAAAAPYELSPLADASVGDWVIAKGEVRKSASGHEIFEIEDVASVTFAIPGDLQLTIRHHHLPVPPSALGFAGAALLLLFFWGLADLVRST